MKKWVIGGALLAAVGIYFAFPPRTTSVPAVTTDPAPAGVAATPVPAAPVLLAKVVDVTDIDPLLDPPTIPVSEPAAPAGSALTAVGYEDPAPRATQPAPGAPPIPPADESEAPAVEVAPVPREVNRQTRGRSEPNQPVRCRHAPKSYGPDWEAEFRPVPGPLLLDGEAVARLPDEDDRDPVYPVYYFLNPKSALEKKNPLAPLVILTDKDLFVQRAELPDAGRKDLSGEPTLRPVSYWLPEPQLADPTVVSVRRVYAVLTVLAQAPATRIEWYTRWYGAGVIPEQAVQTVTAEQIRAIRIPPRLPELCYRF
ncbi:MAG: hypothetical protein JWO38_1053 [Gemmataceae bacterium]|nr:hypothetical protein [Gemmataceae bacterium]